MADNRDVRISRNADDLGYGREDLGEGGCEADGRYSWIRNGPSDGKKPSTSWQKQKQKRSLLHGYPW